jgi:hypothetical protein
MNTSKIIFTGMLTVRQYIFQEIHVYIHMYIDISGNQQDQHSPDEERWREWLDYVGFARAMA